jgi:hypothetical protein
MDRHTWAGAGVAVVFTLAHLALEAASGGIASHHPLADPALPGISNLWGLLTLPLLGALAGRRAAAVGPRVVVLGLLPALCYGGAIALAYELGAAAVAERLFQGLFLLALVLPLYRIECLAGFVVGMTITFGGVLPVVFGGVVALLSVLASFVARGLATLFRRGGRDARSP